MRCVVTGSNGYLGSVLVPMLLARGHKVLGLDSFLYQQCTLLDCCADPNFTLIRGDCRDINLMNELLGDADVFIPLAAIVGAPACDNNLDAFEINFTAIARAIAPGRCKIIGMTSNSGYGIGGPSECTEDSPLNPISLYGRSKVAAEAAILSKGGISLRLATLFGCSPRMRTDLLVNDMTLRAVRDKYVVLYQADARRNYLHVRDAVNAILWALANYDDMKGKPYNVGLPDANLTKRQLCEKIKEHVPDFYFVEAEIGEDPDKRDYVVSNERILSTGWRPKYSLDDGIRELIKGYEILKTPRWANA